MSRKEQKSKQGVENVELLLKLLQEKIRGPYENATISDSNTFSKNTKENCVFWENFIWRIFQYFCRKVCRKLYGNFLYVSSFFVMIFMKLCAGMGKAGSRSNPGVNVAIPIGIALRILVFAARNQRKAKLAPKLENAVSDVIGGGGE